MLALIDQLNAQRGILNEIEESLKEKKRKFKYEIMLSDEIKQLDYIENKVDNQQPLSIDTMKRAGIDVLGIPSTGTKNKPQKLGDLENL